MSVRSGTVSPTLFNLIHEDGGTKNGKPELCMQITAIQKITHCFTHLYYNWPGPIRVPAPCLYATKLANLVGESLHTIHSGKLDEKLFYL
jgi:aubergine-like protein